MLRPSWARLAAAFPPTPSGWVLRELSPDRLSARVAPVPPAAAIRARLDDVVSPAGWSCQLLPLGERALVCNLTVEGVTRAGVYESPPGTVPGSPLGSAAALAEAAFAAAASQFGMRADGAEAWVDHDPESGEVLLDEAVPVGSDVLPASPPESSAGAVLDGATGTTANDVYHQGADARPEAHQVIDRLVERLKAEGLGAAAAKLVVRYGGYGRDAEESRELYGRLRALLMHKVTVPS